MESISFWLPDHIYEWYIDQVDTQEQLDTLLVSVLEQYMLGVNALEMYHTQGAS